MKRITPEDQAVLREKFPKFSKICACYCNNPEYGVYLSAEAERWLNRPSRASFGINTGGLTEAEAEAVQRYIEGHFDSINSFIIWTALQHEEPMHTDVSGSDSDLPDNV